MISYSDDSSAFSYGHDSVEHIDPVIRHDLQHHVKIVTVDEWIKVILDVSLEKIADWSQCLDDTNLLREYTSITKYLQQYCEASIDVDRYSPWSAIVNRIVALAPSLILDLPASPLSPVFVRNDPHTVTTRGRDRASHRPDVLVVPEFVIPNHASEVVPDGEVSSAGVRWSDILACVNFQTCSKGPLKQILRNLERAHENGTLGLKFTDDFSSAKLSEIGPSVEETAESQAHSTGSRTREAPEALVSGSSSRSESGSHTTVFPFTGLEEREAERLATYALELLARTSGTRTHCLQLLVDGHRIMFWYYDAGGIIHSEWMDWIHDLPKFAAIIVAFAQLDMSGWGVGGIPHLKPPSSLTTPTNPLPRSLSGYTLTMAHKTEDGLTHKVKVTLEDEVYSQYGLVGRRTIVYGVTTEPKISEKALVLKMSMQPSDQTPENEFLEHARISGVDHLPEMHMWSTSESEWRLSNGVWGRLFPCNDENGKYKDRIQRLIVFTKYEPIEGILCAANTHNAMMQLINCLHDLRYKAHIIHHDISLGNLMYERLDDGTIWLILNDFDLAVMVDDSGLPVAENASKHRTGTLPFMAHEVLRSANKDPIVHYLRHDYESVFWVALYLVTRPGPKRSRAPTDPEVAKDHVKRMALLKEWELGPLKAIRSLKSNIIRDQTNFREYTPTPAMRHYGSWVTGFWQVLSTAYIAHSNTNKDMFHIFDPPEPPVPQQNIETLGDSITLEKIQEKLRVWEQRQAGQIEDFDPFFTAKRIEH